MANVIAGEIDAIVRIPYEDCLDLRHKVLHPLKPRNFSRVVGDQNAEHYGIKHGDQFVSCLSIFGENPAQIRKIATLQEYQGRGYGSKLMEHALSQLSGPVFLDARTSATGFYERFGFKTIGEPFLKGETEHIRMEL